MMVDRAFQQAGAVLLRHPCFATRLSCDVLLSRRRLAAVAVAGAALCGCASTQFRSAGQMPEEPLCQGSNENVSALVLWGAQWRPDQKEPALREAAAKRGIEKFFADSRCFMNTRVLESVNDRPALDAAPEDLRGLAARERPVASRALFITVRELGPVLKVFNSLALLEGGTELVFDVRSLDIATGRSSSDFQVSWQRGGPWFIKGTSSLDADMRAALAATLRPRAAP
jgi:hypothetical protein